MTIVVVIYGIVGIGLLYSGIGRMHEKGLPPFNEGLYTAVWSVPSPPVEPLGFMDRGLVRSVVWGVMLLVGFGALWPALVERYGSLGFLVLFMWSSSFFVFGIWAWIFSLLN